MHLNVFFCMLFIPLRAKSREVIPRPPSHNTLHTLSPFLSSTSLRKTGITIFSYYLAVQASPTNALSPLPKSYNGPNKEVFDINQAAALIQRHCPQMLEVARSTSKFLYRGEEEASSSAIEGPHVSSPPSDLFDASTYHSILAADFFLTLNQSLAMKSKSGSDGIISLSRGHIATPSLLQASQWGAVHSIWPIGSFDFLWLKDSTLIWRDEWALPQSMHCLLH